MTMNTSNGIHQKMSKHDSGIRFERTDTKTGVVETVTIPEACLWSAPMSLREIGGRVGCDWRTVQGWIGSGELEARPRGALWQVPASLFGWGEIIEAIDRFNARHPATTNDIAAG